MKRKDTEFHCNFLFSLKRKKASKKGMQPPLEPPSPKSRHNKEPDKWKIEMPTLFQFDTNLFLHTFFL